MPSKRKAKQKTLPAHLQSVVLVWLKLTFLSDFYFINQQNTFWLHKTDYIRLKNIELGYTVPSIWSKKIGVEHLRVYINAYNLLTISPDMKDYDPENTSGSGYNYPLNKVINFGVNLTF